VWRPRIDTDAFGLPSTGAAFGRNQVGAASRAARPSGSARRTYQMRARKQEIAN